MLNFKNSLKYVSSSILILNYLEGKKKKPKKKHTTKPWLFLKFPEKDSLKILFQRSSFFIQFSNLVTAHSQKKKYYWRLFFIQQVFAKATLKWKLLLSEFMANLSMRNSEKIKSRIRALSSAHDRMSSQSSYGPSFLLSTYRKKGNSISWAQSS